MTILQGINLTLYLPLKIFKVNDHLVFVDAVGGFYGLLGREYVNFIITYDPESSSSGMWRSYLGPRGHGYGVDRKIRQNLGLVVVMKRSIGLEMKGLCGSRKVEVTWNWVDMLTWVSMPFRDD